MTKKQAFWQSLINDWKQSGLSQAGFCKANNISTKAFYRWKNVLRNKSQFHSTTEPTIANKKQGSFAKLEVTSSSPTKSLILRVGSVEMVVNESTDKPLALSWISFLSKEEWCDQA